MNKEFGQWLKQKVAEAGWSSSSISRAVGYSTSQQMYELYVGRVRVTPEMAIRFGKLLDLDPLAILYKQAECLLAEAERNDDFKPDFSLKKPPGKPWAEHSKRTPWAEHSKRTEIIELVKGGMKPMAVAKQLGVTRQHVYAELARENVRWK